MASTVLLHRVLLGVHQELFGVVSASRQREFYTYRAVAGKAKDQN